MEERCIRILQSGIYGSRVIKFPMHGSAALSEGLWLKSRSRAGVVSWCSRYATMERSLPFLSSLFSDHSSLFVRNLVFVSKERYLYWLTELDLALQSFNLECDGLCGDDVACANCDISFRDLCREDRALSAACHTAAREQMCFYCVTQCPGSSTSRWKYFRFPYLDLGI